MDLIKVKGHRLIEAKNMYIIFNVIMYVLIFLRSIRLQGSSEQLPLVAFE